MGNRFREKEVEEGLVKPKPENAPNHATGQPSATGEGDNSGDSFQEPRKPTPNHGERQEGNRTMRGLGRVLGGEVLGDKVVLRQIPLLLLCLVYMLLIVGSRYHIESLSREKIAAEERINYLREEHIQMQRRYQQSVKVSQIATDLRAQGVGITAGPPYEID